MYLGYERIDADGTVKTVTALTIPARTTHAELQADGNNVNYTMDNVTDPSGTLPRGMVLSTTHEPKLFVIDDVRRIRFTSGAAANGGLNCHYLGGRDV